MMTPPVANQQLGRIARRIELWGTVQGIGLRPAVARLAVECGLTGSVTNTLSGAEISVEGPALMVKEFLQRLPRSLPGAAGLERITVHETEPVGISRFTIQPSTATESMLRTPAPRDAIVCPECLAEVDDSRNRRYRYPFTSCTQCGPRFSIISSMPFDRSQTAMSQFPLCSSCLAEFNNSRDRRFHAQTMACPDCGPHVWATDRTGREIAWHDTALSSATRCLRTGGIVAIRGIGGYQLLCDATNELAVSLLRERKRRRAKPLAVMVDSVGAAQRLAEVETSARDALLSTGNPIVLVAAKASNGLAANIHPGLSTLGLMLASSPLHWLLLRDTGRPLVVTSGNVEGQPLELTPASSQRVLGDIADLWLHHNREIRHAVDDSVVRIIAGRPVTVRLARGLAPLQVPFETAGRVHTFAVGGHQKSAFAVANGGQAVLGPHIGDLDGTDTRERYVQQARLMNQLYRLHPEVWVHDLHPDYFTTQWARSQPGRHVAVQHHHAHVVAGMMEQGWLGREVLGVAFDGTGYGTDGTVWGGEFLQATATGFSRVAHLRTFSLAGNEAAVREPWRVAMALAHQAVDIDDPHSGLSPFERASAIRIRQILERPALSTRTSSAGRLFDGVASLVMGIKIAEYEGQAAQLLESISDPADTSGYSLPMRGIEVDWRPMIRELLIDRQAGIAPGTLAMRFHRGLALAIASVCARFAHLPIVLVGGVFQNRLLVELVVEALRGHPQLLGLPGIIPPNDGGLAAGQLAVGLMTATRNRKC